VQLVPDTRHRIDMSNFLRRLPLSRLLLLCATIVVVGIGATALATALSTGPTPPPKPLAEAVHDALAAGVGGVPINGVSARIQLTDHLIEASSLAGPAGGGGGSIASSPLLTGASGRLWIAADGRVRLELQAEQGDTQIIYDGHTVSMYDTASNTLYRYTVPAGEGGGATGSSGSSGTGSSSAGDHHAIPTVAEIEEAITHVMGHANLSGAVPTNVAGQPAYSVRISPSHDGGLVGGAELAWDAVHGTPLRLAVYSTQSSTPVLELTATEISYGAVPDSVFSISPPAGVKVTEVMPPSKPAGAGDGTGTNGADTNGAGPFKNVTGLAAVQAAVPFTVDAPATLAGMSQGEVRLVELNGHPSALIVYGRGLGGIAVLEGQAKAGEESASQSLPSELPKVALPGASATELPTALGTLLSFQRAGVTYLLAGSVTPATIEAAAKGL
jgi:outer membrane lipoprotein-sorting protein